jgi:hypothetical protein
MKNIIDWQFVCGVVSCRKKLEKDFAGIETTVHQI